ncbi:deoxyribose-phosphate aldolase [Tepidibacillus marianensis]|uniref:deoxyribose-phosphate aldolase n=1 Tax=Tepidibacillus marianensis TaxID=3131995 RepID=UPI0030CE902A
MDSKALARMIDHTLLKPDATREMIDQLCKEAKEYEFASVCVNPYWVARSFENLKDTNVKVCTVIGFPLGATTKEVKAFETTKSIADGATEVDMVLNIGALKFKQYDIVEQDIKAVAEAAKGKALVKVILETGLLNQEEKIKACEISKKSGADYVKTSTGFGHGGATYEDIKLMRETVGLEMGVKASGGVRDLEGALKMVEAGATRIGASSGVAIVNGLKAETDY